MIRSLPNGVHTTRLLLPIFESSNYRGWQVDLGAKFLQLVGLRKTPLNYARDAVDDHQFHWAERICIDGILDA